MIKFILLTKARIKQQKRSRVRGFISDRRLLLFSSEKRQQQRWQTEVKRARETQRSNSNTIKMTITDS